jgi:hypothetical protein
LTLSVPEDRKPGCHTPLPDDHDLEEVPAGVARRSFLMRSAVIGAAALIMDRTLQLALRMVQASD